MDVHRVSNVARQIRRFASHPEIIDRANDKIYHVNNAILLGRAISRR